MNRLSVFYEHIADAVQQSGLPLEEVCARVKGFGFDAVEMDAQRLLKEWDIIMPALKKAGIGVNCIYNFFDFGLTEDSLAADCAEAQNIVDLCVRADCGKILAVGGFLKGGEIVRRSPAYEARRIRMAKALEQLVALAAEKNITVVMEDFDSLTAPFSTAEELLWFMENVKGMRCGFDMGNFQYCEQDAAAVLPDFLPYISAVHCKDRGWTDNGSEPKRTVAERKMYSVAVGDGDLDIAGMVKTVLDTGYTGALAAEHFGSADQLRDMERSAKFLRGLLENAGA